MIKQKHIQTLILVIGVASLVGLLFFIFLGLYVKPGADDLYYLSYNGLAPYYTFHFLNGRITSILLYGLLYPIPGALQLIPAIGILALLFSFYIFYGSLLRPALSLSRKEMAVTIGSLAALSSLITILTLPGIYASFYWFAAAPVHTWSITCALLYLGLVIKFARAPYLQWWKFALFALGAVIIGCLAELGAAALFAIAVCTIVMSVIKKHQQALKTGVILLGSTLISLGILFFSPGAVSRRAHVSAVSETSTRDSLMQLPTALIDNLQLTVHYLQNPTLLAVAFLMIACVALYVPIKNKVSSSLTYPQQALIVVLLAAGYIAMNTTVLWLGLHENQPVRSYFSTALTLTLVSVLLGLLLGLSLRTTSRRIKRIFTLTSTSLCILIIGINAAFLPTFTSFYSDLTYRHTEWNKRETLIEATLRKDNCQTKIPALPIRGMWSESTDASYWVNGSLAFYYHLPCSPAAQNQVPKDIFTPAG